MIERLFQVHHLPRPVDDLRAEDDVLVHGVAGIEEILAQILGAELIDDIAVRLVRIEVLLELRRRDETGILVAAHPAPASAEFLHHVEDHQVRLFFQRRGNQFLHRVRFDVIVRIDLQDIVPFRQGDAVFAGDRLPFVLLGDDPAIPVGIRFQHPAEHLDGTVRAAVIHENVLDGRISLRQEAPGAGLDIVFHAIDRDDNGNQRPLHQTISLKRSGIRTMSTSSSMPGLFHAYGGRQMA